MARQFQEVFGGNCKSSLPSLRVVCSFLDMLLTQPVNPSVNHLPSPNQLKRKILIKVLCCLMVCLSAAYCYSTRNLKSTETSFQCQLSRILKVCFNNNLLLVARVCPIDPINFELMDLSNSIKNGQLFLQNPIDKVSHSHCNQPRPFTTSITDVVGVAGALLCAHSKAVDLHR